MSPFSTFAVNSLTLAWNPSTSTNVAGYKIYSGLASGVYSSTNSISGSTNVTLTGLIEGSTYYFAATTVDTLGNESPFSDEASYSIPVTSVSTNSTVAPNLPPTFNALTNLTINENAGLQTVDLTGITSGASYQLQTLTVTAVSSNPALIPNPTVNYASPNGTGTLNFAPATSSYGTATITVTINNNGASNNLVVQSFKVTVNAVNQSPTLNPINNLSIAQSSGQKTVSLTGINSGLTNQTQPVAVTVKSSNTAIITTPTITYKFPNSTGTLSFATQILAGGSIGSSIISVTVNNGQKTNNIITRQFTVTVVSAGSTAPKITSQPINLVALAGQTVTFSVAATGTSPLTYQWQCNSNAMPSATNAVLKLTSVTANQAGHYSVTVANVLGMTNTTAALTVYPTAAATMATATRPSHGQFAMTINGVPGYKYSVQVSTNMISWSSVQTNTAPFTFVDTNASHFSQRFYRSVYLP